MEDNIILLLQLVRHLESSVQGLEKAYNNSNREQFNKYKKAVLDFQNKLDFVLKNYVD
jgi:hypothetical protein